LPLYLNGFSGLGSPWWLPDVESGFAGKDALTATDEEKIAAVMESIVFLLAVNMEAMRALLGPPNHFLVTGGLGSVDSLLQTLANIGGVPVERARSTEATARGLAYLLAGMPDVWPAPNIEHGFAPLDDPGLSERFSSWRKLMPATGE